MKYDGTFPDSVIYRCDCGHPLFLEVTNFDDECDEIVLAFCEEPKDWWYWIKGLFRKRRYINEIILTRKQAKELAEYLLLTPTTRGKGGKV
jgi:hypothetical protein